MLISHQDTVAGRISAKKYRQKKRFVSLLSMIICGTVDYGVCSLLLRLKAPPSSWEGVLIIVRGSFWTLLVCFCSFKFTMRIITKRWNNLFSYELKDIMFEFDMGKDPIKFYNSLLNMKNRPRSMYAMNIWYLNVTSSLAMQGKKQEAISMLGELHNTLPVYKNLVRKQIEDIEKLNKKEERI